MSATIRIGDLTVEHAAPLAASTNRPVLFVHGMFVDARLWAGWLPLFAARGIPAYAINLRGRAGSRPGTDLGAARIEDFAADVAEVARHLGNPSIIGHSMGGLVTQKAVEMGVGHAAVLITPAPPRGIVLFNPRLTLKQLKYLPQVLMNRVIDPDLEDLRDVALNRASRELQDAALAEMVPDSGHAGRQMSMTGVPVDRSKIQCPLRVIAAEHDQFVPAGVVAKIAKRYGVPLETKRGHGHMVVVEPGWEDFANDIGSWIAGLA